MGMHVHQLMPVLVQTSAIYGYIAATVSRVGKGQGDEPVPYWKFPDVRPCPDYMKKRLQVA